MGSSLAFSLKEDPVRCAKVCDESWVILRYCSQGHEYKNTISKNIFAYSDIFRFMMHMHTLDVDRKIGDFKPSEERPP